MIRAVAGYAYAAGILLALTIAVHAMGVAGMQRRSITMTEDGPVWMSQAQQSETGKTFRGTGVVTAIEPNGSLTINHEPIAGLMPAMEMTFSVNPRALTTGVRPGDKIEFSVEGTTYILRAVKVVGHIQ
jgi:Cu/Ag efflux protein CusF